MSLSSMKRDVRARRGNYFMAASSAIGLDSGWLYNHSYSGSAVQEQPRLQHQRHIRNSWDEILRSGDDLKASNERDVFTCSVHSCYRMSKTGARSTDTVTEWFSERRGTLHEISRENAASSESAPLRHREWIISLRSFSGVDAEICNTVTGVAQWEIYVKFNIIYVSYDPLKSLC